MDMLLYDYHDAMELAFTSEYTPTHAVHMLSNTVKSMMKTIETNLEVGASKYQGSHSCLRHIFLMNNYKQILVQLEGCKALSKILGQDFKEHLERKVQENVHNHLQHTWKEMIMLIGNQDPKSSSSASKSSKDKMKSKMKAFNAAFEQSHDQYCKIVIFDDALRAVVQQSISQLLIPAHHAFIQSLIKEHRAWKLNSITLKYTTDMLRTMVGEMLNCKVESDTVSGLSQN
ncbi:hypothetical protein KP509_20G050400 [Ceratopteris richardii]|nr:hypothetical protein KP509_20G050400 [Ceratopteris richardii]